MRCRWGRRHARAAAFGIALLAAPDAAGAEATRRVVAGPQYQADAFHSFLLGRDYRDLWTAEIEAPGPRQRESIEATSLAQAPGPPIPFR